MIREWKVVVVHDLVLVRSDATQAKVTNLNNITQSVPK